MICNLNVEKLILLKDVYQPLTPQTFAQKTAENFADDIDMLIALALQDEKVVSVKAFETDDARVFGILTLPIFLKSERDELVESLEKILSQGKPAYVSLDGDVYRKTKDDMPDEQKIKLLSTVMSRKNTK